MKGEIQSYQDLRAWQEGMNLAEHCYQVTRLFPKSELYGMVSQIRRASVSVPSNIAEGYGRGSRGEYLQFLQIAQGSLNELITQLLLAKRVELVASELLCPVLEQCNLVSKILYALIRSLKPN